MNDEQTGAAAEHFRPYLETIAAIMEPLPWYERAAVCTELRRVADNIDPEPPAERKRRALMELQVNPWREGESLIQKATGRRGQVHSRPASNRVTMRWFDGYGGGYIDSHWYGVAEFMPDNTPTCDGTGANT